MGQHAASKRWDKEVTFVEAQNSRLRRCIICQASDAYEACSACDRHDMALIMPEHVWQESLGGVPVAEDVYVEDLSEVRVGCGEDGMGCQKASVVDEDCSCPHCFLDFLGHRVDFGRVSDVALEEFEAGICRLR